MNVSFILHLYQPSTQDESVFRQIYSQCYFPLLKLIKQKRKARLTLNLPLSLLEQMEKYGYTEWIAEMKSLATSMKIEIISSSAYHTLLTKVPTNFATDSIILNEYGLAYFLGSKQGFEGDVALQLSDVKGFFPPELALNSKLVELLSTLGYDWVLSDSLSVSDADYRNGPVFKFKDNTCLILTRNKLLSDMIASKRDENLNDILTEVLRLKELDQDTIVSLDAETFGHHFKDGIYLLDVLLDELDQRGVTVTTTSDLVSQHEPYEIDTLHESTWGASKEEFEAGDIYPFWINKRNESQKLLWELEKKALNSYISTTDSSPDENLITYPVWNCHLDSSTPAALTPQEKINMILQRFSQSDKYWALSKKETFNSGIIYNPKMSIKAIGLLKGLEDISPQLFNDLDIDKVLTSISS